jgi:hypothetical protein
MRTCPSNPVFSLYILIVLQIGSKSVLEQSMHHRKPVRENLFPYWDSIFPWQWRWLSLFSVRILFYSPGGWKEERNTLGCALQRRMRAAYCSSRGVSLFYTPTQRAAGSWFRPGNGRILVTSRKEGSDGSRRAALHPPAAMPPWIRSIDQTFRTVRAPLERLSRRVVQY